MPASLGSVLEQSRRPYILFKSSIVSRTAFPEKNGPKYLALSFFRVRENRILGYGSCTVTLIYGYVLSSTSIVLYLGRCSLIRLFSRTSASSSVSVTMYSKYAICFTMLSIAGPRPILARKYERTRLCRTFALPI